MLTYREVLLAITSLDTELDIIERACKEIAEKRLKTLARSELASELFDRYEDVEDQTEVILALCFVLGRKAALHAKEGHEAECLMVLTKSMLSSFNIMRKRMTGKELNIDVRTL